MRVLFPASFITFILLCGCNYDITNNYHQYDAQQDSIEQTTITPSGMNHDTMIHLIEYHALKLQKTSAVLEEYQLHLQDVKDTSGTFYKVIKGSKLDKELNKFNPTTRKLKVNKVVVPLLNKTRAKLENVEILVKSDPLFTGDVEPVQPLSRITSGGCIWRYYDDQKDKDNLIVYRDNEVPLGSYKYKYAIPFPAVTHFHKMKKGEQLKPKTVIFPFNNELYMDSIKNYGLNNSVISIGFHKEDLDSIYNNDIKEYLFVAKTLWFYDSHDTPEDRPKFPLKYID